MRVSRTHISQRPRTRLRLPGGISTSLPTTYKTPLQAGIFHGRGVLVAAMPSIPGAGSRYHHDLIGAINAHMTNTPRQMAAALASNATWLEGDIRLVSGRPRMAHLPIDVPAGMDTETWLRIAATSGRSIKMDFKDSTAIEPTIALIRKLGIEDHRLMFNITVSGRRFGNVTTNEAMHIRRRFPNAVIALATDDASYPPVLLRDLGRMARAVGGTTQVMMRWDLVGPHSISLLQKYTNVGIWNEPLIASPRDIPAEVTRLRSLGVTGVIDLR